MIKHALGSALVVTLLVSHSVASASPDGSADVPATAPAATAPSSRAIQVGLRAGLPLGMGEATKGVSLADQADAAAAAWVDLGYRFNPHVYAGLYGQYVYVAPKTGPAACPEGATCSAYAVAFGINAHYHFLPARSFDPWVGLGIGYEMASLSGKMGPMEFGGNIRGIQFVNVQAGSDFRLTRALGVGPFLSCGITEFTRSTTTMGGVDTDASIPSDQRRIHASLIFGARGTFDIAL
jgi:outer membrane protein W